MNVRTSGAGIISPIESTPRSKSGAARVSTKSRDSAPAAFHIETTFQGETRAAPVRAERPRGFIVNPRSFGLEPALRPLLNNSGRLSFARPMHDQRPARRSAWASRALDPAHP